MRAPTRRLFAALAVSAGVALAACGGGSGGSAPASAAGEMTMGQANAPVTVVEYASVTCGVCAAWNQQVFPEFKRRYIDTGRVRYVFREFLTPPEPLAAQGFMLARCAGPDRYFGVIDALFRGQQEMGRTGDTRGTLLRIAQSAGMSEQRFTTCLRDEAALVAVNERQEAGIAAGITGTPTFLVNGRNIGSGNLPLAQFSAAIDPLLGARAPAAAAPAANPAPVGGSAPSTAVGAAPAVAPTTAGPVTAAPAAAPAQ